MPQREGCYHQVPPLEASDGSICLRPDSPGLVSRAWQTRQVEPGHVPRRLVTFEVSWGLFRHLIAETQAHSRASDKELPASDSDLKQTSMEALCLQY